MNKKQIEDEIWIVLISILLILSMRYIYLKSENLKTEKINSVITTKNKDK